MSEVRDEVIKYLAHSWKWQSLDSNSGSWDPKFMHPTTMVFKQQNS